MLIKGYKGSQQSLSGDSLVFTNIKGIIKNVFIGQNNDKVLAESERTMIQTKLFSSLTVTFH